MRRKRRSADRQADWRYRLGQGKQAKVLRKAELQRLLNHVSHTRHPERDRVMVLLSFKAGLRAVEILRLTWSMVTTATGELADAISLPNAASKGKGGGRTIPLHSELHDALASLMAARGDKVRADRRVIHSERADGYAPTASRFGFLPGFGKSASRVLRRIPGDGPSSPLRRRRLPKLVAR
jgi:integrase